MSSELDSVYFSDDPRTNSEDAFILKVIEAYNTSAKTRHTVNSCKSAITSLYHLPLLLDVYVSISEQFEN